MIRSRDIRHAVAALGRGLSIDLSQIVVCSAGRGASDQAGRRSVNRILDGEMVPMPKSHALRYLSIDLPQQADDSDPVRIPGAIARGVWPLDAARWRGVSVRASRANSSCHTECYATPRFSRRASRSILTAAWAWIRLRAATETCRALSMCHSSAAPGERGARAGAGQRTFFAGGYFGAARRQAFRGRSKTSRHGKAERFVVPPSALLLKTSLRQTIELRATAYGIAATRQAKPVGMLGKHGLCLGRGQFGGY